MWHALHNDRSHGWRYTNVVPSTATVTHSLGVVSPRRLIGSKLIEDLVGFHCRLWHWYQMWLMVTVPKRSRILFIAVDGEGVVVAKVVVAVRHDENGAV